jgi:Uma2 family endonuclease
MPQASQTMSEADYLAFERASELKHEYFAGEVFAMSGASEAHNLICTSTSFLLYGQLRSRPCNVYPGDMRVKVEATGLYTYPDISVVCGEAQFSDDHLDTLVNPTVIIEVLSPSTEGYDRGKKFQQYREIPSLREYLLISQDSPRIERYGRQSDGTWVFDDAHGLDAHLALASIDCRLALAEVYERVTFPAEDDATAGE